MTLSKYTNNLYQSEVYRELERQAVKKGFFKPTDAELVKLAAQEVIHTQQINQPIDDTPSDDLIQDVARLAYAMRRKGFVTQAEDIEQKLVMYKTAENALYNVTQETNADLIGFAHRDGDVNLIEGSGDLGTFETLQSVADKILAVTRKQPTGKQPMNRMAALAAMINKVAQGYTPEAVPTSTNKTREQIIEGAKTALSSFDASRQTPPNDGLIVFDLEKFPNQIPSYMFFSGIANPQNIMTWFRVKAIARQMGVLLDNAGIASIDVNKLYQTISINKLVSNINPLNQLKSAQDIVQEKTKHLSLLALNLGVLQQFQSMFLYETSDKFLLKGGLEVGLNSDNALAACKFLATAAQTLYNAVWGENNSLLAAAQNKAQNIISTLFTKIKSINITIKDENLTSDIVRNLARISREIEIIKREFENKPAHDHLLNIDKEKVTALDVWVNKLKTDIDASYSGISTPQMAIANIDSSKLGEIYEQLVSNNDDRAGNVKTLLSIIQKHNGEPWIEMQDALKNSSLKITEPTVDSFNSSIDTIVNSIRRS